MRLPDVPAGFISLPSSPNACRPLPTLRTSTDNTNCAERQSRLSKAYLLSDISYPSQAEHSDHPSKLADPSKILRRSVVPVG